MNDKELSTALIRSDFYSFVQRVFYEVTGGQEFVPNWHIEVLCDALERARRGEIKRLIINVPPRSLKSIIVNVAFPAWILAHNPREKIISASYSNDLSETFARDCKRVIMSNWFRELFPRCVIASDQTSTTDFKTQSRGGRFSTSVESTFTGRGGNFIIIDDPIKGADAMSESARNKVIEWYQHTLLSRLDSQGNGVIILIMQRVHENDLTGYLLENSTEWTHIKMPQIAITDEQWPVGNKTFIRRAGNILHKGYMSPAKTQELRQSLGTYVWSAQYQQEPCPPEGGIVKESWLHYYQQEKFDIDNVARVFISWDTANKTGDTNAYSAAVAVVMTYDRRFYLVDVYRDRWDMPTLVKMATDIYNGWKYDTYAGNTVTMLIEDAASGTQLIQCLNAARDAHGLQFNIVPIKPNGDKVSRLIGCSALIENAALQFPQEERPWWAEFKKELLSFPGSRYKDQVDALTQCINYAMQQS